MSFKVLKISARQSELAQLQARLVGAALERSNPSIKIEFQFRESLGDQNQNDPLWKMPEKGVFTEDFYLDLVDEKTDIVVHSWKDLPTEVKPDTIIAATLPRADQRDLLLFKKTSRGKNEVKIFSSSPRRAFNLAPFLKSALPFKTNFIHFENVRGNIKTRINKLLQQDADALIVAKAAFDRLASAEASTESREFLQSVLQQCEWMVLPLTENPNAAAQGALALEVKNTRTDVIELLKKINCEDSYVQAESERQWLRSYGGGCHLALGMSSLSRPYGQIRIIKGQTPEGKTISEKTIETRKKIPQGLSRQKLQFKVTREKLPAPDVSGLNALYVSKFEAWNSDLNFAGIIWTAGLETWKKLAAQGVWVNGSQESLGEGENMYLQAFASELKWGRLSHSEASTRGSKKAVAAYKIQYELLTQEVPSRHVAFEWTSPQEFDIAVKRWPEIKNQYHICGPGRTYEALLERLGHDEKLFIEINL